VQNISFRSVNFYFVLSTIGWSVIRKYPTCKKVSEDAGMVFCLDQGAGDLHVVRQMLLPTHCLLHIKIQDGLTSGCWLTQVVLDKRPLNGSSTPYITHMQSAIYLIYLYKQYI